MHGMTLKCDVNLGFKNEKIISVCFNSDANSLNSCMVRTTGGFLKTCRASKKRR